MRQYNEYYFLFGFISFGEEQLWPKYVVCGEKLENQGMVLSTLKHTFTQSAHIYMTSTEYFKRLSSWSNMTA
jgi:hypothetical protein